MKMYLRKASFLIIVCGVLFWTANLGAGEHGGKEHGGHEHGGKEHGGHEHGGKEHGGKDAKISLKSLEDIQASPTKNADGTISLNNKICHVTGDEVSGKHSVLANGVIYETCCKKCVRKLKKNPDKYVLSMDEILKAMESKG